MWCQTDEWFRAISALCRLIEEYLFYNLSHKSGVTLS